jgi:hypothetical protein
MDRADRRGLHPLLLLPSYWRDRLEELRATRFAPLFLPREDLSAPFVEVEEFRARTHDGQRLWGLRGRCRLRVEPTGVRVRLVGPAERPEIDREHVIQGEIEYVLQVPAGRKLEDRVLDALQLVRMVVEREGVEPSRIQLAAGDGESGPDELRIAAQVLSGVETD